MKFINQVHYKLSLLLISILFSTYSAADNNGQYFCLDDVDQVSFQADTIYNAPNNTMNTVHHHSIIFNTFNSPWTIANFDWGHKSADIKNRIMTLHNSPPQPAIILTRNKQIKDIKNEVAFLALGTLVISPYTTPDNIVNDRFICKNVGIFAYADGGGGYNIWGVLSNTPIINSINCEHWQNGNRIADSFMVSILPRSDSSNIMTITNFPFAEQKRCENDNYKPKYSLQPVSSVEK